MPKRSDTEPSIRSKLSKRSNRKGSGGELKVAKLLQAWWQPIDPDCKFVRVPRSGGWVYGPDFGACGDIMAKSDPPFPFGVEVKYRQDWQLSTLLKGQPSPVWSWWRQCQHDARQLKKEPMLWFRKNHQVWLVMMSRSLISSLKIEPPHHAWPDSLNRQVDCDEIPVLYNGNNLLALPPETFLPNQTRPNEQTQEQSTRQENNLSQAQASRQTAGQEREPQEPGGSQEIPD